ncbi:MAG: putative zinc-binding metallopeptidase [Candidatus Peregrinibacteria bacterium]
MIIRILALFVAIQTIAFAFWQNTIVKPVVIPQKPRIQTEEVQPTPTKTIPSPVVAPAIPQRIPSVVAPTPSMPVTSQSEAAVQKKEVTSLANVHFSARNVASGSGTSNEVNLEQTIKTVLAHLPQDHVASLANVILDFDPQAYRGLGGKKMVILRANMEQGELIGVLVHELGHNVDLIALDSAKAAMASGFKDGATLVYLGDLSLDFYRISWMDEQTLKKTMGNLDFVSGYAMTDPFEDFAETYAYYVLHNQDFKAKVSTSAPLYAKYRFMKYRVFKGVEFDTGDAKVETLSRPWDVTILPYKLEQFLN